MMDWRGSLEGLRQRMMDAYPGVDSRTMERALEKVARTSMQADETRLRNAVATAQLLVDYRLSEATVLAELVRPFAEAGADTKALEGEFGKEVAGMAAELAAINKIAGEGNSEKTEKMLLTLARDFRLLLIILAERKTRLAQSLQEGREDKALAAEVLEIYAPLAEKLGINELRNALEDLAFRALYTGEYQRLAEKLRQSEKARERELQLAVETLGKELARQGIKARIESRFKHLYGVYKKMKRKGVPLEQIYDLNAVRVITDSAVACYEVLGIVHSLWKPMPGEFDDYIAKPKPNYYQSLHAAVVGANGVPFEVQIRTEEMHGFAEYGVAAHWRYRGTREAKAHDKKLELIRQLLEWAIKAPEKERLQDVKAQFFENRITVFTPKGDAIELPQGATALDFAYAIHSELGNKTHKVKINRKLVALEHELSSGDTVEIITSAKQTPKRAWLLAVKTDKAKKRIRQALHLEMTAPSTPRFEPLGAAIRVTGERKSLRYAKCCNPLPSDKIVGYLTTKRKIMVHATHCVELAKKNEPRKLVALDWGKNVGGKYTVELHVLSSDRPGVLTDILNAVSRQKVPIKSANAKSAPRGTALSVFSFELTNMAQLDRIVASIQKVRGVKDVSRAGS